MSSRRGQLARAGRGRRRSRSTRRRRAGRPRRAGRAPARDSKRRLARPPDRDRQVVDDAAASTIAARWRPASPPQVRWIDLGAGLGRVLARQDAVRLDLGVEPRRAVRDRPTAMTIVRDGWRPVSAWMVAAQRSAISGRRATTTRFITLVRAAMWRAGSPSIVGRQVLARPRSGRARSRSRRCCARAPASAASARRSGIGRVDGHRRRRLRSGASAARRARAARRRRPDPTSRRRSSGSRAPGRPAQASMIGSTMPHASSTSSARVNSEASPRQRVEDQRLVGVGRVDAERRAVGEVHRHRRGRRAEARAPWPRTAA